MDLGDLYRRVKENSKFTDSPWERLGQLLLSMIVSPTLPNVMLGASMTATLQHSVGMVGMEFVIITWVAWVASAVLFAIGEEVTEAIKVAKQEVEEKDDVDKQYH